MNKALKKTLIVIAVLLAAFLALKAAGVNIALPLHVPPAEVSEPSTAAEKAAKEEKEVKDESPAEGK
jgi:predicted small lipoprotein YifL